MKKKYSVTLAITSAILLGDMARIAQVAQTLKPEGQPRHTYFIKDKKSKKQRRRS